MYLTNLSVIAFVLLFFVSIKKRSNTNCVLFEKMDSINYKGLMALMVFFHHVSIVFNDGILLKLFNSAGYLACAMFFFLSGYGKTKKLSFNNKKKYIYKQIKKIAIIITECAIISYIVLLIKTKSISTACLLLFVPNSEVPIYYWFIIVYILLETLLCIELLISKNRKTLVLLSFLFNISLILILKLNNFSENWYNSLITFSLGILLSLYEEEIDKFINARYTSFLFVNIIIFVIAFVVGRIFTKGTLLIDIIKINTFVLSCALFNKTHLINSKAFQFFGNMSLEFFIIHRLLLTTLLIEDINSNFIFSIYTILSIVISFIIYKALVFYKKKIEW